MDMDNIKSVEDQILADGELITMDRATANESGAFLSERRPPDTLM